MKKYIAMLCAVGCAFVSPAQSDNSYLDIYLTFEDKAYNLSKDEEGKLLDVVYDLMLSQTVHIELLRCGNSYAAQEIMSRRADFFTEMCKEYDISELTTRIDVVNDRFKDEPQANVRIHYYNPEIQAKARREEASFTHRDGWRARCFAEDVSFVRQSVVQVMHKPEEFESIHLLTEDEDGNRLNILAIVSIRLPGDTLLPAPFQLSIPLRGVSETGCKEYMLMRNGSYTFLSDEQKASVKREDAMLVWKLSIDRSGTYVIARPTDDQQMVAFTAPEGYVILSGTATSMSPYMQVNADVDINQLTATFNQMPNLDEVFCEFVLADMTGREYTTTGMSAKTLMNDPLLSFFKRNVNTLPDPVVAERKQK